MSVDLEFIERTYFYFDEPVKYNENIKIYPISVRDSEIFISSVDIISIDKNSLPDPQIIQMSYLQFLAFIVLKNENERQKFINLMVLCLGIKRPRFELDEKKKIYIVDEETGVSIAAKQFEDIRRIILYQNFIHFDDSYINPDLKKAMAEQDRVKNVGIDTISLERKMAIITSHCGFGKKEMMEMSYRAFSLLFEEVCGEVDFITTRPILMLSKESAQKMEHWIFRRKKNKMEDYITSVEKYNKSMGGNGHVKVVTPPSSNSK